LRRRLTLPLLLAVLLTALVQGVVTWRGGRAETEALFDAQMERTALSLTGGLAARVLGDEAPAPIPGSPDEIIQIWRADGTMLYRSPSRRLLPPQAEIGFSNVQASGHPYRVYTLVTPIQVIQVAQSEAARSRAVGNLALRAVLPIALLAPLLMLIVWWVVGYTLAPVEHLRRVLVGRAAGDLAPLPTADLPAEIRPMVSAMNGLLERLESAWQALSDFTGDAAHELRSPLAALRLQVQSLQRAPDAAARKVATERLLAGVDRATRLIEQLLTLARQERAPQAGLERRVDLAQLAGSGVAALQAEADARRVALAQAGDPAAPVHGDADALAVLLRNLLENALRYAPDGGRVRVTVHAAAAEASALLCVEDSGPGIAPEDRLRVLDRFYRAPDARGHGSGLGLAIVRTIAARGGAVVEVGASVDLGGASVTVRWPAAA
jgi:two-component system OmpR family sensor kinase